MGAWKLGYYVDGKTQLAATGTAGRSEASSRARSHRSHRSRALVCAAALATALPACADSAPHARSHDAAAPLEETGCARDEVTALPDDAGCATSLVADADGDGDDDTLWVHARVDANGIPVSWHVTLQTEQETTRPLDTSPRTFPRAAAAADVDDDGRSEWFVKTLDLAGHGTAWQQLSIFQLVRGDLRIVSLDDEPFRVRVGGVSRMGEGIACRNGRLQVLRTEARNVRNTRWRTSIRTYRLRRSEVRLTRTRRGVLELSDYNDADLDPYYRLECDGVVYPG